MLQARPQAPLGLTKATRPKTQSPKERESSSRQGRARLMMVVALARVAAPPKTRPPGRATETTAAAPAVAPVAAHLVTEGRTKAPEIQARERAAHRMTLTIRRAQVRALAVPTTTKTSPARAKNPIARGQTCGGTCEQSQRGPKPKAMKMCVHVSVTATTW